MRQARRRDGSTRKRYAFKLFPLLSISALTLFSSPPCPKVLNVLVNNSGATWGESLETYPDQAFTKLMTLNVQRVFTLSQKLVPLLKKGAEGGGVGRIINVSLVST